MAVWVGVAVAAVAVAAAAASAYAQYEAGEAQAKGFKYQARDAENRARAAREAASVRERQQREKSDRIRAMARTRAAASGVDPSEGSPLLVMLENSRQAELDASFIRYAGATQSTFLESESKLRTFQGKSARQSAQIGAGATLLGGVASGTSAGYSVYNSGRTPSATRAGGSGGDG